VQRLVQVLEQPQARLWEGRPVRQSAQVWVRRRAPQKELDRETMSLSNRLPGIAWSLSLELDRARQLACIRPARRLALKCGAELPLQRNEE
jgi:hypothetical protein